MLLSELTGLKISRDPEIEYVTNNSKDASEKTVFVCIRGANSDGHDYIQNAYENGCRVFVCEKDAHIPALPSDAYVIVRSNTRRALAEMSDKIYGSPSKKLRLIAVTGTKGKTSVAFCVNSILKAAGKRTALFGTVGIYIGERYIPSANTTPDSTVLHKYLAESVKEGVEFAVMEVSSQALMQERVYGLNFDASVYTNLSPDHISPLEHKDFDDYRLCKSKLMESSELCIINADDENAGFMAERAKGRVVTVSEKSSADYRIAHARYAGDSIMRMSFELSGKKLSAPSPGKFSVMNAAEAAAVCLELGIDEDCVRKGLENAVIPGRFEFVNAYNGAAAVIDYAHNGLSLRSALTVLREYMKETDSNGRLITLFGSIGCRAQKRRAEMAKTAAELSDFIIITSDNPDKENPDDIINEIERGLPSGFSDYVKITDRAEAVRFAAGMLKKGDVLLLAGKGHEKYQLINGIKVPFCEKELLTEALASQPTA